METFSYVLLKIKKLTCLYLTSNSEILVSSVTMKVICSLTVSLKGHYLGFNYLNLQMSTWRKLQMQYYAPLLISETIEMVMIRRFLCNSRTDGNGNEIIK